MVEDVEYDRDTKPARSAAAYTYDMKAIWQGHVLRATSKYGEHAPMAAVCCNACRTCATTNLAGLGLAAIAGVGAFVTRKVTKPF